MSLTKKLRELRIKNEKLTLGQAIRLFLEQVGVVGIKLGQILSEHETLVSGEIRSELSSLRDKAAPFAKYGIFTYLRVGGLSKESRQKGPYLVTEVGDCLGSASIKQAHKVVVESSPEEGSEPQPGAAAMQAVGKFPRPSIEKNFQEDVHVLQGVSEVLRFQGTNLPPRLVEEVVNACRAEFDFSLEAEAQTEMGETLQRRNANVEMAGQELPLAVPKVLYVVKKGEGKAENIQLTLEEYIPGLTFAEIEEYQKLCQEAAPRSEERSRKEELEAKLQEIYGDRAPLATHEYASLPMREIRSQIAVELLTEIVEDGRFHADLHSGNSIIDLTQGKRRIALIDFGSAGRSLELTDAGREDHREPFRDFLQNILLLRFQLSDMQKLGRVLERYVKHPTFQAADWSQRITALNQKHQGVGKFFQEFLSDLLGQQAEIHPQFRLLLKSLAAAGAHLDALATTIAGAISTALARAASEGRPILETLFEHPTMKKLQPFLEKIPSLQQKLTALLQSRAA